MEYTNQEKIFIYEMKKSIINEFRYKNKKTEYDFVTIFGAPDMSIDVDSLQEAFRVGMSYEEKKTIRKLNKSDLFNQALAELFEENLHHEIFDAFEREEEHMYEFQIGGRGPNDPNSKRYGSSEDEDGKVSKTTIESLKLKSDCCAISSIVFFTHFGKIQIV